MLRWLVVAFGLLLCGPDAMAAKGPKNPLEMAEEARDDQKSDAELKAEERQRLIEEAQSDAAARVIVLRWPGTVEPGPDDIILQQAIKIRTARPKAKFFPEIDLYQKGREMTFDPTIRPIDQLASVPDDAIGRVQAVADDVAAMGWDDLTDTEWGLKAEELRESLHEIWFIDRAELREPLFALYIQIGRAAENAGLTTPPWYAEVSNQAVNYYWYLAASMAFTSPDLLSKISDDGVRSTISYYRDQIVSGSIEKLVLSFEDQGFWDAGKFAGDYEVFINGEAVNITNKDALHEVPRGRVDVYMSRVDGGHSLSDRVEVLKYDGKVYAVRDTARKLMGIDFVGQLMERPNECIAQLSGDIITSLAIYQRLHPDADVFLAVPVGGSNKEVLLWRYDRELALVRKVEDPTGGFPVRFAALVGAGTTFNSIDQSYDPAGDTQDAVTNGTASIEPGGNAGGAGGQIESAPAEAFDPNAAVDNFSIAGVPLHYQLRMHVSNLMVVFGMDFALAVNSDPDASGEEVDAGTGFPGCTSPCWEEAINGGNYAPYSAAKNQKADPLITSTTIVQEDNPATPEDDETASSTLFTPMTRQYKWQRLIWMGVGVMLLKDAPFGMGPRAYIRAGIYNVPRAVDLSLHLGITEDIPMGKGEGKMQEAADKKGGAGRIRPIIDGDLWAGMVLPYGRTIHGSKFSSATGLAVKRAPIFNFGFSIGAGITF